MLASDILTRVRTTLVDLGKTRWQDADLLRWLSDGQRTIAAANPVAVSKRDKMQLAAGTEQKLPADGFQLLSVVRNTTSGGAAGRAIRQIDKTVTDAFNPDWHTDPPMAKVISYVYDPNLPDQFYVSPPNDGSGWVEVIYGQKPPEITALTDALVIKDPYQQALVDYVLFRAQQMDDDYSSANPVSQAYLQLFLTQAGAGAQGSAATSPKGDA